MEVRSLFDECIQCQIIQIRRDKNSLTVENVCQALQRRRAITPQLIKDQDQIIIKQKEHNHQIVDIDENI